MGGRSGYRLRTRLVRGPEVGRPVPGDLVPPIHPSAAYVRFPDGTYPGGHSYTRDRNPTFAPAERLLADLEGGTQALLFSSGMAAATAVLDALPPGAHVVAPRNMYFTLGMWMRGLARRGRIRLTAVANDDVAAVRRAVRPGHTALVWMETPANPMTDILDLAAWAEAARRAGAVAVADGTIATPLLCRPLEHGADIVFHSASKQLNGHSDVVAGVLVTASRSALWERIREDRANRGAIAGPFEAWLLLRGLRTLALRVEAASRNALTMAETLARHPGVREVFYPGLPSHPGHELARRQMRGGFGPLVSFRVRGGGAVARRVAAGTRIFRNASSIGGVESLIEHRRAVEGPGSTVPADLLRLSVGIEDAGDLVDDLVEALAAARHPARRAP